MAKEFGGRNRYDQRAVTGKADGTYRVPANVQDRAGMKQGRKYRIYRESIPENSVEFAALAEDPTGLTLISENGGVGFFKAKGLRSSLLDDHIITAEDEPITFPPYYPAEGNRTTLNFCLVLILSQNPPPLHSYEQFLWAALRRIAGDAEPIIEGDITRNSKPSKRA